MKKRAKRRGNGTAKTAATATAGAKGRGAERLALRGVFTALVTPFRAGGALDEPALRRLVRAQIAGGVAGVVPMGTTGESATVSADEHERVVAVVADEARAAARRVLVIAGAGSNDTHKAADLAVRSARAGADALLAVTPYYNKPKQDGLEAHFRAIADAAPLPVVLYNVPGRTGSNLLPETVLRLAADRRFAAVKEASANLDQVSEILRGRPAGFAVLSGEDSLTLPIVALGGDGVIAVVSNEAPALLVALVDAALAGRRDEAAALHARLLPLMKANFLESNPIPVKWAVARMGLCGPHLRLPLTPLSPAVGEKMEAILRDLDLLGEGTGGERRAGAERRARGERRTGERRAETTSAARTRDRGKPAAASSARSARSSASAAKSATGARRPGS